MKVYELYKEDLSGLSVMGSSTTTQMIGLYASKELAAKAARVDFVPHFRTYKDAGWDHIKADFKFKKMSANRWSSKDLNCCIYYIVETYVIESEEELPAPKEQQ